MSSTDPWRSRVATPLGAEDEMDSDEPRSHDGWPSRWLTAAEPSPWQVEWSGQGEQGCIDAGWGQLRWSGNTWTVTIAAPRSSATRWSGAGTSLPLSGTQIARQCLPGALSLGEAVLLTSRGHMMPAILAATLGSLGIITGVRAWLNRRRGGHDVTAEIDAELWMTLRYLNSCLGAERTAVRRLLYALVAAQNHKQHQAVAQQLANLSASARTWKELPAVAISEMAAALLASIPA